METLAQRIGPHKGYKSGIERGKVNPPSVRVIKKYARALGLDVRQTVRIAWVDKAPRIVREDAERFLEWCQTEVSPGKSDTQTDPSTS